MTTTTGHDTGRSRRWGRWDHFRGLGTATIAIRMAKNFTKPETYGWGILLDLVCFDQGLTACSLAAFWQAPFKAKWHKKRRGGLGEVWPFIPNLTLAFQKDKSNGKQPFSMLSQTKTKQPIKKFRNATGIPPTPNSIINQVTQQSSKMFASFQVSPTHLNSK